MRPFGVFVEMAGYRRHGLVHNSQVSEDMAFSREDEDEAKVKAMEFCAPVGSQVALPHSRTSRLRINLSWRVADKCSDFFLAAEAGALTDAGIASLHTLLICQSTFFQ